MKNFILNWIYQHYKKDIESMMLMDMYGFIPSDIRQPSIDFLVNGKDKLEKFFSVQAYEMQRRSIMDEKNAGKYQGMLLHIKSLLVLLRAGVKPTISIPEVEKVADPLDGVKSFVEEGKKINKGLTI